MDFDLYFGKKKKFGPFNLSSSFLDKTSSSLTNLNFPKPLNTYKPFEPLKPYKPYVPPINLFPPKPLKPTGPFLPAQTIGSNCCPFPARRLDPLGHDLGPAMEIGVNGTMHPAIARGPLGNPLLKPPGGP